MKKNYGVHVVPARHNGHNWKVEFAGKSKKEFDTQSKAIPYATKLAKQEHTELFIHGRNGRIRERNSFGNDPRSSRG